MFHKTIVAGYLGRDPEQRFTANGNEVASFSVATTEKWGKEEDQQHTEWYNCTAFGKTAEVVNKFFTKGKPILVEGKMRTEQYEDKQGETKYSVKLMVDRVTFLPDGGSGGGRRESSDRDDREADRRSDRKAAREEVRNDQKRQEPQGNKNDDFDDDIPF